MSKTVSISGGPPDEGRLVVDRPPMGSLLAMLFRSLVDRLQFHMAARWFEPVRSSHLYVLRALYPTSLSVTDLAESCGVTKQAVSQILVAMADSGLTQQIADKVDGRVKLVSLTPHGLAVLDAAVIAWGDVETEWADLLGDPSMEAVREAMIAYVATYGDWRPGDQPRLRPVW